MFIEELFTIVKIWKHPNCPSIDEWIKKLWYSCTMEYLAIKKKDILPFVTAWMDLESIILIEISQSEKDKYDRTGVSNSFSPGATSASQLPSKGRM